MAGVNVVPMNQLQYAQPVSNTDEFVICQTPGGCGAGNQLLRITMANLAAFILSLGNTGVIGFATIDLGVAGDHIITIKPPPGLASYIVNTVYVANPLHNVSTAVLNLYTGPNGTGQVIIGSGMTIAAPNGFNTLGNPNFNITYTVTTIYANVGPAESQSCPAVVAIVGFFIP